MDGVDEADGYAESGKSAKKRRWTANELLQLVQKHEKDYQKVAEEVTNSMLPDEGIEDTTDALDKLTTTIQSIRNKIMHLHKQKKKRKFRHRAGELDSTFISASQHSIFGSEKHEVEDEGPFSSQEMLEELEDLPQSTPKEHDRKPLTDLTLTRKHRLERVKKYRETLIQWSKEQRCSVTELCGFFIQVANYLNDRSMAKIGWNIFISNMPHQRGTCQESSVYEAMWILSRLKLSHRMYTELRIRFLDRIVLPPIHVVAEKSVLMQPVTKEYKKGVLANLPNCLRMTISEQLSLLNEEEIGEIVHFSFSYGFDGSGDQKDYHQKKDHSTSHIFNVCFTLNEITKPDGTILWSSKELGHNSPRITRPVGLFPAKESDKLLKEFFPKIEKETKEILKGEGLKICLSNKDIKAKATKASLSQIDGKMISSLLQLKGAYCTMCSWSFEQCHDINNVEEGNFKITRNPEDLHFLALILEDEAGKVQRSQNDYHVRQGVTGEPIVTDTNVCQVIPIMHLKIHAFNWLMELLVRQNSHQCWHSHARPLRKTNDQKDLERMSRESIKKELKENYGINMSEAGDITKGNNFARFSSDSVRKFLVTLLDDESKKEDFDFIFLHLCALVRILNTQQRKINITRFKTVSTEVYKTILKAFPWCAISPSIHRVLAHGWEVCEINEGMGPGNLSEEGSEGMHKFIRYLREHGARKTSTLDNFTDTFNKLWRLSSPIIVSMDRERRRNKTGKLVFPSEIDTLVETLFDEMN